MSVVPRSFRNPHWLSGRSPWSRCVVRRLSRILASICNGEQRYITLLETQKAIRLLSSGKAPGSDSIPAEVYKEGGSALTEKLHQLFLLMWQQETIPQEFKDVSIIHVYKRKGNHQVCDNHRGVSYIEKYQEQNSDLFSTYVDLNKAFDTVSREKTSQESPSQQFSR